jgi:hypothetical protein
MNTSKPSHYPGATTVREVHLHIRSTHEHEYLDAFAVPDHNLKPCT